MVIGSSGVFAVETKTRRKPILGAGQQAEVIFDGEHLRWLGKWAESKPIRQARNNAESLGKWITEQTALRVPVGPVIALPGWGLKIEKYGDVAVYSATNMSDHLTKRSSGELLPAQIESIAYQLTRICTVDT